MAYNSDGYIMFDFSDVDFRRTTQTIPGLYERCVKIIGTNKFILVINANGKTPLPSVCSFINNQYVIESCLYTFAITSNDTILIRRNEPDPSQLINDEIISPLFTWSSSKIDSELDTKADASALADYQPLLTAGTNITIDENNVISSTGGAVIDDSLIVNNKVWSSLNTVEKLAPIDTIINNPVEFKTSLALPLIACKVPFSAKQEGSGDPSPDNVRPIHGFSEVNATHNKYDNLLDNTTYETGKYINANGEVSNSGAWSVTDYIEIVGNNLYIAYNLATSGSGAYCAAYRADYSLVETYPIIAKQALPINAPADAKYLRLSLRTMLPEQWGASLYLSDIHTIQLGQEVYGAEVDFVNGVAHVDRAIKVLDGSHSVVVQQNYIKSDACCGSVTFNDIYPRVSVAAQPNLLCDKLTQSKTYNFWQNVGYPNVWGIINANVLINIDNTSLGITDYTQETTTTVSAKINAWLVNNPVHLIIPIETFDIQLTPTQIETLIGNNTISTDGDILTVSYRHLPIDLI